MRRVGVTIPSSYGVMYSCRRHQAINNVLPDVNYQQVWALWNEGNLFSLNVTQLHSFLSKQGVKAEQASKKAALVRLTEELLQAADNKSKGIAPPPTQQSGGAYGKWDQAAPAPAPETLLDLNQAGFFQEGNISMAPKAFQILVQGNSPDLVVSRVNTTSFPGYAANAECFTLTAANADLAVRARYSKALQWCAMNLRNLQAEGEIAIDFGKLVLNRAVVRRHRQIVSAWTLQQRVQVNKPYLWVSTVAQNNTKDIEVFLQSEGFVLKTVAKPPVTFDVSIRRANDKINLQLDSKGVPVVVNDPITLIQQSHVIVPNGGLDGRLMVRCRTKLNPQDIATFMRANIIELDGEDIKDVLPAHLGQVVYASENETRFWEKVHPDNGITFTVKETKRMPLILVKEEEEDARTEFLVTLPLPTGPKTDLNALGNELFAFVRRFSAAGTKAFVEEYATQTEPVVMDLE